MADEPKRLIELLAQGRDAGERIALSAIYQLVREELEAAFQHDLDAVTAANEVLTVKLTQCRDRLSECRDETHRLRAILEGRE